MKNATRLLVCAVAVSGFAGCLEEGEGGAAAVPGAVAAVTSRSDAWMSARGILNLKSYGALSKSGTDWADAFDAAIRDAVATYKIVFVPPGTYPVSRQIYIRLEGDTGGNSREQTCVIMGSANRPTVELKANSTGFSGLSAPKCVFKFENFGGPGTYREGEVKHDSLFNSKIVNLTIRIRSGNPWAGGIELIGAQGSGLQDVTVDMTESDTSGHTGIVGGCGAGGSHVGVTVLGGRIGLDLSEATPAATLAAVTLDGQREAAILYSGQQSLSAVGVKIRSSAPGPLVRYGAKGWGMHGFMTFTDSQVEFAAQSEQNIAFENRRSIYLRDVFVKNARVLVRNIRGGATEDQTLASYAWSRVKEYARGSVDASFFSGANRYSFPRWTAGARYTTAAVAVEPGIPAGDLRARHHWGANFPTWEDSNLVDVTDYGATPNDNTDDAAAIQNALTAAASTGATVFIPAGTFWVGKTLQLPANARLVGVARHLSVLRAMKKSGGDFLGGPGPDGVFGTADDVSRPILRTVNAADDATKVGFLQIKTHNGDTSRDAAGAAYGLAWQCGRNSILRSINFSNKFFNVDPPGPLQTHPFALVSGNGGGKWYEFYNLSSNRHAASYRHLLVQGTRQPLEIYQCNNEYAHGRSGPNPNMEINGAWHVSLYGLKGEGNAPIVWIRNADHVRIFGYGGNATADAGSSLIRVWDTKNWLMANAVDMPRVTGAHEGSSGVAIDPSLWSMVWERHEGQTFETWKEGQTGADRPVLYRRGDPAAFAVAADDTAPTCLIAAPAAGATVSGAVAVSASAADTVGVAKVEFRIDGALRMTDTVAPYGFTWDSTTVANGTHTIEARAYDAANNATPAAIQVSVLNDLAAPTVSITAPAGGATVSGTQVSVAASAGDDVGVTKVEFRVDGALKNTQTSAPYSFIWDSTTVADGTHTIEARAYDAAGRTSTAGRTVTVSNDVTGPTLSFTSPSNGATVTGRSVTVSVAASDPAGVQQVAFFINGAWKYTDQAGPWSYVWDTAGYKGQTVTIKANARDTKGNLTSKSISVNVR